ncbi:hypothetical protein DYB38_010001 [Aphanomyces astaci]|uniref:KIF-binding protein n=1 Tax=Aphanomyces astaci TaxID=112090 RepID=A0A397C066_APHAT|nr:hypothetical protein DYB38_010001 [Aphanomyces astaci]RHY95985.1 hypothetical protein DYB31_016075 [Aphanomyces astaci]
MYRESLRLQRDVLKRENHSHVAEVMNYLGICLSTRKGFNAVNQSLFRQAESLLIEAKTMRELVLGTLHVDYATSLNNLANFYKSALQMLSSRHTDGPDSKLFGWGGVLLKSDDQIMDLYEESLAIRKMLSPDQMHPHVAQSLNNMALFLSHTLDKPPRKYVHCHDKDYLSAEQYCVEALKIRKQYYNHDNDRVAQTLLNLGRIYVAQVLSI